MATFTIGVKANTTGIHHVGYRTYNDPALTYTVIDVDVPTPGNYSVIIPVPGNLYCADSDILYTGYVIAACRSQVDGDGNGIPDLATTWSITLVQQTDPCIKTDILCESVAIASVTIDDIGAGCAPDATYPLTITEATLGDEILPADIDVTISGGVVTGYVINDPGQYKAAPTLSHTIPGCGTPPAFTAVLEADCPSLLLSDYDCLTSVDLSETPDYIIAHNDSVVICADVSTLAGLATNFASSPVIDVSPLGNCHCEPCRTVTVAPTGATIGAGKVTYQTCWDGTNPYGTVVMVSQIINYDTVLNMGCIMVDTLVTDQGTLDQPIVITSQTSC